MESVILTARRATTGDILLQHNVAAMDLEFAWNLKLRLLSHEYFFPIRVTPFCKVLDDSQRLQTYERAGLLDVEVVTQTRRELHPAR